MKIREALNVIKTDLQDARTAEPSLGPMPTDQHIGEISQALLSRLMTMDTGDFFALMGRAAIVHEEQS